MANRVAVIGCGVMGGAIGTRLREVGETLTVFDIDETRMQALVDRGAVAARSASEAAARSDYVILSLNSAAIVRDAVFGAHGAATGAKPGTMIIDMSSIDPPSTRTLAAGCGTQAPAMGRLPALGRRTQGSHRYPRGHGRRHRRGLRGVEGGDAASLRQLHPHGPVGRRADHQADQPGAVRAALHGHRGGDAARAGRRSGCDEDPAGARRRSGRQAPSCRSSW